MRCFVILCALAVPVLSALEGYNYREPAPVIEKHGLHAAGLPCKHAGTAYNFDAATTALINSQTDARIVNHKEHNLETAASGYSVQSHALPPPNQFGSVSKGGSFQGSTNTFSSGQGYIQNGLSSGQFQSGHVPPPPPSPSVNYIPVSQIPPPSPPPQGHHISQIPPPLSIVQSQSFYSGSGQAQGYNYNQASGAQYSHNQQQQGLPSFPAPTLHRPQTIGLTPPGPVTGSQHSSNFGNQHSSNFGNQHSSNFGSQHSSNFGNQHSSNFANQPSSNFAGQHSTNFANQHSSNLVGQHSTNFANQHSANAASSNFGSQLSSNFANQQNSNFGAQHSGGFTSFSSSSLGANGLSGQLGSVIRETVASAPLDPFAEKHIYVHIPPEDMEASSHQALLAAPQFTAPPKKHYKIVFIKAPSHAAPNYSQLAAAAAPKVEEKTLIYVLVKKPEEPSLDQIQELTQPLHKPSKPEVYFIKYKTQKEAASIPIQIANSAGLTADQIDLTNGDLTNGLIDIRSGGNAVSGISDGPKHELYGVPLQ